VPRCGSPRAVSPIYLTTMGTTRKSVAPDRAWSVPASSWVEIIARYTTLLQVRTWRATVRGEEHPCLSAREANVLRASMLVAFDRVAAGRSKKTRPSSQDLEELWSRRGTSTPRSERCPSRLQVHFQRAFLLDISGYKCAYCHRTAWDVFEERSVGELPRTLRFEVDHHRARARLVDRGHFDAN